MSLDRGPASVVVIEDDLVTVESLIPALWDEGYTVSLVTVYGEVLDRGGGARLLIFSLDLGADGPDTVRRFRDRSAAPVLATSRSAELADKLAGFRAGVDDYLVKPYSMEELLMRANALIKRGERLAPPRRLQVGRLALDLGQRQVSWDGSPLDVTPTQFAILHALANTPGEAVSKSRLVDQIWGATPRGQNVIEVHVCELRRRLAALGINVVHTVRGFGYMLSDGVGADRLERVGHHEGTP